MSKEFKEIARKLVYAYRPNYSMKLLAEQIEIVLHEVDHEAERRGFEKGIGEAAQCTFAWGLTKSKGGVQTLIDAIETIKPPRPLEEKP